MIFLGISITEKGHQLYDIALILSVDCQVCLDSLFGKKASSINFQAQHLKKVVVVKINSLRASIELQTTIFAASFHLTTFFSRESEKTSRKLVHTIIKNLTFMRTLEYLIIALDSRTQLYLLSPKGNYFQMLCD